MISRDDVMTNNGKKSKSGGANILPQTDLWDKIYRLDMLDRAWEKVRANGGCAGGDGISVDQFQRGAAKKLIDLARHIKLGEYTPQDLRLVDIPKKKGGTRRLVIPSIVDRVAQTSVAMVLTPILDQQFEDSSFAYRPGRSVKQAVHAIDKWRKQGYWHVIEADIVRYFDNVRHDLLMEKLENALVSQSGADQIIELVAIWLEHAGQQTARMGRGVAQGSPLSPILANLYLDSVDEQLKTKGVRLVRFADDFILLCKKQASAESALIHAQKLMDEHGLELHKKGTRVVDFDRGFEFLGHLFVRSMVVQRISDPEEDAIGLLREVAVEDRVSAAAKAKEDAALKKESDGGYDRGARVLYINEPGRTLTLRNLSFSVKNSEGRELAAIAHNRVDRIEVGSGEIGRAHV